MIDLQERWQAYLVTARLCSCTGLHYCGEMTRTGGIRTLFLLCQELRYLTLKVV